MLGEGSSSPAPATKSFLRVHVESLAAGIATRLWGEAVREKQSLLQ